MLDIKVKDLFVESDHMKVFKKAIQNGLPNPEDYMYMYSRVLGGGSIIMDLAVGDYITIKCYQDSGSAQNITGSTNQSSNIFSGFKLT